MSSAVSYTTILKELGIKLPELDTTHSITGRNTQPSKKAEWMHVDSWYVP